jgi:glycosyltransferase involved in cell wall biosynthesis
MPKHIALISEHASPLSALGGVDSGGQNVYVAQVARHLTRLGYRVDVFTRRDDPHLETVVDLGSGLRVIHVDAGPVSYVAKEDMLPWMRDFAGWMKAFIAQQGMYDLIHANFFMSGVVAAELKRDLGIPFVVTFHALGKVRLLHQGGVDRFPRDRGAIEARIMAEADAIIAECPQDEADHRQLYGADPAKIRLAPCGFDNAEFWPIKRAVARRHLNLDVNERWVVHIGRMVPRKGVDTAIEGFARLVKRHGIAARMLVVGGEADEPDPKLTPEIGRLQQVAEQEGVSDRVVFTGRRGRQLLRFFYSAADVFITTPWYEPFGITPVESMACGTPVIGSDVGGVKYTVRHCRTGFLVPPNDPDAIGMRLAQLFRRPQLLERMRAAAIARANRYFTWPRVTAQIATIYEEVLSRTGVGQPALEFENALFAPQ